MHADLTFLNRKNIVTVTTLVTTPDGVKCKIWLNFTLRTLLTVLCSVLLLEHNQRS